MYNYYKNEIYVGYNSRNYDVWIYKAILCDFNPKEMNDWLILKERKGFEFSPLLSKFPILNYDCSVGFKSLKELEAYMGHSIVESSVPFDIDRKLTNQEIEEVVKYCHTDVMETFHVFVEMKHEYESHIGLIQEFKLPLYSINKTKAQLSADILGAYKKPHNDEFDVTIADTVELDKYSYIEDFYINWSKNEQDYEKMSLETEICGVPHKFGIGGLHGAVENYIGDGLYLMADVASYYPALMIEYDFLSRNVRNKLKYKQIRDERLVMKANKDKRQQPRKIVLNGTFGASKDKYNNLYDALQANNVCINGQLMLTDLLEKLEGLVQVIQSNTDGILVKLYSADDKEQVISICNDWSKRTRMELEFDEYSKVIQKDVNNYIIVDKDGNVKRKGAYVKKLSKLDNDLPIVNKAVVEYFVNNIPVEKTIRESNNLIDFQKICKVSAKYEYGFKENITGKLHSFTTTQKKGKNKVEVVREYVGYKTKEKIYRVFASKDIKDGGFYKKHKGKTTLDKVGGTPDKCFILNENIENMQLPSKLDIQYYIDLAKKRINDFLGK